MTSEEIKAIRNELGMSQAKFAEFTGVPRRTIQNWESGIAVPPDYIPKMLKAWVEKKIKEQ